MDAKFRCKQNLETLPGKKHLHCKRQEDLILRDDSEHDLQFYLKVKGREIWNFSAIFTIQLIHFPEVIFLASPAVFEHDLWIAIWLRDPRDSLNFCS